MSLNRIWLRYLEIGLGPDLTADEADYVRATNGFAIAIFLFGWLGAIFFALAELLSVGTLGQSWAIVVADLAMASLLLTSVILNNHYRYTAAKYLLIIFLNLWTMALILVWGPVTRLEYFLLLLSVIPVLLFNRRIEIVILGAVSVFLFGLAQIIFQYVEPILGLNPRLAVLGLAVNSVVLFGTLFFIVWATQRRYDNLKATLIGERENLAAVAVKLEQAKLRIEELSVIDQLTGLPGRLKTDALLNEEYIRANRYSLPLTIIIFDVDRFRWINDHHGREVGEQVLQKIAALALEEARDVDIVGRWDWETFMIICPQSDAPAAQVLAERLRAAMEAEPLSLAGTTTCSFGLAELERDETVEEFYERAEAAVDRAKDEGRNRVEVG